MDGSKAAGQLACWGGGEWMSNEQLRGAGLILLLVSDTHTHTHTHIATMMLVEWGVSGEEGGRLGGGQSQGQGQGGDGRGGGGGGFGVC